MSDTKKRVIIYIAVVAILVGICAIMMVIGRGHTIYFDNKTLEYNGQTYKAFHKVEVSIKGERVAKLYEKERGSSTCMGQTFKMSLAVSDDSTGDANYDIAIPLPYGMDGIIVNLPALLNGLPEDAWLTEFIPEPDTEEDVEEVNTDEFSIDEFGDSDIEGEIAE